MLIWYYFLLWLWTTPVHNWFEWHFDGQSLLFILVQKDIISYTFFHCLVIIINNFFKILMNDSFSNFSLKNSKIKNFFLILLKLIEGRDIIDNTIDPNCLNIGYMIGFYFIRYVISISFINLLFSQDLCLQLFFVTIRKLFYLLSIFI